jgi:hypothetical protein
MSTLASPPKKSTPSPRSGLNQRLAALRFRMLLLGLLCGIGWAIVGGVLLFCAGIWLDLLWELSPGLRVAANIVAVVAAIGLLIATVLVWKSRGADRALARRLDRAGGTGGQILSGYDLERASFPDYYSPHTEGMAAIAAQRAADVAARIPAAQAVPAKAIRPAVFAALSLIVAVGLLAVLLPRLVQTEWLRFADPYGDHPPYSRILFNVSPGDVKVRYGSGLDVQVTTSDDLVERVELVLVEGESEEVLPMFPEAGGAWRATLTRVLEPTKYFVRASGSRSHRFGIDVITLPSLEEVRFQVTPPAYTRLPTYDGPLPQGGLAGLPGAKVQVKVKSNRPLRSGTLVFTHGKTETKLELTPVSPKANTVQGNFEITTAGKFSLRVTDIAGEDSQDQFAGTVTLLNDDRPFVRIRQPAPVSLATPEATLPILMAGEDDYGISQLQLYRSLNESRATPLGVEVPKPAITRFDADEGLPLSAYGLSPGDVIKLFARIEDNDPALAKGSESPLVEVRIISQEEYEQMLRRKEGLQVLLSKYQQAQRRLETLAAELEEQKKGLQKKSKESASEEQKEELKKLTKRLKREAAEIRSAAKHLLPFDLDENMVEHLEKLAKDLEDEAQALEEQDLEKLTEGDLADLMEQLQKRLAKKQEEQAKEVAEPMEHLERIYPIIEDQSRFVQIYHRQVELAERLASLKGKDGADDPLLKGRMRDLELEQRQIREDLDTLLVDIQNHAELLPEDERLDDLRATALKFVDDVRASEAEEQMQAAENGLVEFSGDQAAKSAQDAAETLAKFLSQCEQTAGAGQACLKFSPGLQQALGDTIAQLLGEAGLPKPGDGPGAGSGGGFSSRRNSLRNVGLYGQMPGMEQNAGNQSGKQSPAAAGGTYSGNAASHENAELVGARGVLEAAGSGNVPVPVRYRTRVGAYFERIVDEGESP